MEQLKPAEQGVMYVLVTEIFARPAQMGTARMQMVSVSLVGIQIANFATTLSKNVARVH